MLEPGTLTLEPWNFETSGPWKLLEPWTPGTLELLEPCWNPAWYRGSNLDQEPWNPGILEP